MFDLALCYPDANSSQDPQDSQNPTRSSSLPVTNLSCQPKILARVIAVAGHVAFAQLHHLDVSTFSELKRRHRIQEKEKEKEKESKKGDKRRGRASTCISASSLVTPAKVSRIIPHQNFQVLKAVLEVV